MGLRMRGMVGTECKDVLLIAQLVEKGINTLIRSERDAKYPDTRGISRGRLLEEYSTVSTRLSPETGGLDFAFVLGGQRNSLTLYIHCDTDNKAHFPKSLVLLMGTGGREDSVMGAALTALSFLGEAKMQSELTGMGWQELDVETPSLFDAIKTGLIPLPDLSHVIDLMDGKKIYRSPMNFYKSLEAETEMRKFANRYDTLGDTPALRAEFDGSPLLSLLRPPQAPEPVQPAAVTSSATATTRHSPRR